MIYRQIGRLSLLLLLLAMTACSSDDRQDVSDEQHCYLDIYVYSPDRPMVTRADIDYYSETEAEGAVHSLQIWIFRHHDGEPLGYLEATPAANELSNGHQYRITVTPSIAEGNDRSVDVYVLSNVTSATCGLTLNRNSTRANLDAAVIVGSYFGVSPIKQVVPSGGLPMSGVLKNAPVAGSYPALRIGTDDHMSTVKLSRTVSKLRVVVCRINDDGEEPSAKLDKISAIQINGSQIPKEEYLMLSEPFNASLNPMDPFASSRMHINRTAGDDTDYVEDPFSFGSLTSEQIPVADPLEYIYNSKEYPTPQAYEDAIYKAAHPTDGTDPKLLDLGATYLRESDKKLEGQVTYTTVDGASKTVEFAMDRAGDFTRDHSWIIYVFFAGGKLQVFNVVQVGIKEWTTGKTEDHEVHNW